MPQVPKELFKRGGDQRQQQGEDEHAALLLGHQESEEAV